MRGGIFGRGGDWFIVGGEGGGDHRSCEPDVWPLLCFVPNSYIHVSVSDLYIFSRSVCLFGCSKIGPIVEIYKLLTDT